MTVRNDWAVCPRCGDRHDQRSRCTLERVITPAPESTVDPDARTPEPEELNRTINGVPVSEVREGARLAFATEGVERITPVEQYTEASIRLTRFIAELEAIGDISERNRTIRALVVWFNVE